MLINTLEKFLFPNSLIKEYQHWYVLVRPMQVTLGSIIILNKDENITSFGNLDSPSFNELQLVIKECEIGLKSFVNYDKINYLMLMMSDPEVHFHVIPRYYNIKTFKNQEFPDQSYPTAPDLSRFIKIEKEDIIDLANELKKYIK